MYANYALISADSKVQIEEAKHLDWNVDFVSRINIGYPASTEQDVDRFRSLNWIYASPSVSTLERILLFLPPSLVVGFYGSLYTVSQEDKLYNNPRNFPIEAQPLLWTLRFIASCVYDPDYSSALLGIETRPPLAAVILDMIQLATYLQSISDDAPQPLCIVLRGFLSCRPLRSSMEHEPGEAALPYLADLFKIISCCNAGFTENNIWSKLDGWNIRLRKSKDQAPKWTTTIKFPGPDYLVYGSRRWTSMNVPDEPDLPLDYVDADYISSGPFKLIFASKVEEHLTFNDRREIRLYCGGQKSIPIFNLLEGHQLAGYSKA